jgi:hypothetical protein
MRINELLEGKYFDDMKFIKPVEGGGRELNFDLAEDLIHFMHNDDDVYRRHVFPSLTRCIDKKGKIDSNVFKPAVENSYHAYIKKFPIRELPDQLDEKLCNDICKKMLEDTKEHISNGKYKD